MTPAIVAIGTASPTYRGKQQHVSEFMADVLQLTATEKRRIQTLYQTSGIEYRHSVLDDFDKPSGSFTFFPNEKTAPFPTTAARMMVYKQHALPLVLQAIANCFQSLVDFDPKTITHVLTVSCTGMYAPGLDIEIIEQLNLATHIQRTAVNFMGCYGVFNAIKVANAICKADPKATILVVSVELCTLHFQKSKSMNNLIASAIFADGAGAVVIQAMPQHPKYFSLENFYCDLLPETKQEMSWHIADQGFDMVLSAYVPRIIESGIAEFTTRLLQRQPFNIKSMDYYAIHPGGLKILQACEQALKISADDNRYSYGVLRDHGNMSSTTILFVLQRIWHDLSALAHQKNIFCCAFGPGLTLESMLLKINHA